MKYMLLLIPLMAIMGCVTAKKPVIQYHAPDYFILKSGISLMDIDPLGNLYVVDGTQRLSKFDTTGLVLHHVVNNNLGSIHSIDVGNPFKVLVFYRDQQTIILYDRTLSEIQRIPLTGWDLQDVTAVCLSPDNAIWLFDGTKKVLMKMSDKGDAILTSDPFDVMGPSSARPDYIFDIDHFLLVKEDGRPLSVFNDFGNYLRAMEFIGEEFTIYNDIIVFQAEKELRFFDYSDQLFLKPFAPNNVVLGNRVHLFGNRYYTWDEQGVFIGER